MATIADILMAQGEAAARARQARGAIWGNAVSDIGRTFAGAAQQANDPRRQLEQQAVAHGQQDVAGQQALAGLQQAQGAQPQGPAGPEGGTLPPQNFMRQEGGATVWDAPKVEQYLSSIPGLNVPDIMTHVHAMNDAHLKEASQGQAFQQAQTNAIARTAGGTRALIAGLVKAGAPLDGAVSSSLDTIRPLLIANGRPAQQVDEILTALKAHPEQADSYLQQLEAQSSEKNQVIGEGGTMVTPSGNTVATGAPKPEKPTEAELAMKAAGGDPTAVKAMGILKPAPQKNPPGIEEQYLEAVTKGDGAAAQRILGTLKMTAAAKRDPAATALAAELGALRKEEAQGRLDALKEKNAPLDVSSDQRTTLSGKSYLDMGDFETPTAKQKAREAAKTAGLPVVTKEIGDSLKAADQAKLNMTAMLRNIESKLPKDAAGRLVVGPSNKLSQYFQTDADIAAFQSWRSAAIQAAQAMAEKGMGFRLNQAEIALIQSTDQTQLTDTVGAARARLRNILTMLQNKEDVALTKDRSTLGSTPPETNAPALTPGLQRLGARP